MRWASYESAQDGNVHLGQVVSDKIHGLETGTDLIGVLRGEGLDVAGARALDDPFEIVPFSTARLQSPIMRPPSIRDFMSFETHVVTSMKAIGEEVSPVWYEQPVFYFSNPAAVVGPAEDVRVSPGSDEFDFELEIAAVIGKTADNTSVDAADDLIAGYTLMCDWSARDLQRQESLIGLGPAKGKDGATTLGPILITPDELEPFRRAKGYNISMTVDVNGRRYSAGNWDSIYWSFAQMIAYASRGTTLIPGDVIGSGTVGTGCILELGRVHGRDTFPYLIAGDIVAIKVEQFGAFETRIVAGASPLPI